MESAPFNNTINEQVTRSVDLLISKNEHYNDGKDKLASFKKAAGLRGQTPRQALAGMMLKHTVSVYDLCDLEDVASLEVWNEKITDHINYLLLLRAIVEEEYFEICDQNDEEREEAHLAELRSRLTGPLDGDPKDTAR